MQKNSIISADSFLMFKRYLISAPKLAQLAILVVERAENHPSTSKGESYELLAKVSTLQ